MATKIRSRPKRKPRPGPTRPAPTAEPVAEQTHVAHLVAEYWPYARSGGLAEAVRGIAVFQAKSGVPTLVLLPLYRRVRAAADDLVTVGEPLAVIFDQREERFQLWEAADPDAGPRVVFVDHPGLYDREGLYGEGGADYPDNHIRFAFFAKAALRALPELVQHPLVLHAHDWHTALAPVYLRTVLNDDPWYSRIAAVLSVHNAGYPGWFGPEILDEVGLPPEVFHWSKMEHYGNLNWIKGGLAYSDYVGTVSPTHAHELRTPAGGFGLHDSFISLGDRLVGILNGIDLDIWNPEADPVLPARFSRHDLTGKKICKADLQKRLGLPVRDDVPLFGMTARLVRQKGLDLVVGDGLLYRLPDAQFVFVGEGEVKYRNALAEAARHMPEKVSAWFEFTEEREHRLLAAADCLLMPSLYEPCGLTQMRAQRYGALPVVRRVGGLSDTVEDQVTGFVFDDYSSAGLERAIRRALALYPDREAWERHMGEAMSRDFGWARSAERYLEVYRNALAHHAAE
jgi:starch synthase